MLHAACRNPAPIGAAGKCMRSSELYIGAYCLAGLSGYIFSCSCRAGQSRAEQSRGFLPCAEPNDVL